MRWPGMQHTWTGRIGVTAPKVRAWHTHTAEGLRVEKSPCHVRICWFYHGDSTEFSRSRPFLH